MLHSIREPDGLVAIAPSESDPPSRPEPDGAARPLRATRAAPAVVRVMIAAEPDVEAARRAAYHLASQLAFSRADLTCIAAAIHEVAQNIVAHAGPGELQCLIAERNGRLGIVIVAEDRGPGISDVTRALEEGFSTIGHLGLGLAGARRLMDEFEIASELGRGTRVTMGKWIH